MATVVLCCASVVVVLGGTEPAAAAVTRYVATTGDDQGGANPCTAEATPCRSIGHAVAQAVAGDTVQIASGAYAENLTLDKNLTLVRDPGASGQAVIDGNGNDVITVSSGVSVTLRRLFVFDGRHGVNNAGSLTIDGGTYDSNDGSGVFSTGSVIASGALFRRNVAGSGVLASGAGSATVSDSRLSENLVGLGSEDTARISVFNSTFDENRFGVLSGSSTQAIVSSSTIVESNIAVWSNSASSDAEAVIVLASTLADNTTGTRNERLLRVGGTIWARNGTDCAEDPLTDDGYNLAQGTACVFASSTSASSTDAQLQQSLTDNGGPTMTLAPASTSPAVDRIPLTGGFQLCSESIGRTDQRGVPRSVGGACDVGSVELVDSSPVLTSSAGPGVSERTFTLTVTGEAGLPDPQGAVTFTIAGSPVTTCADLPIADNQASCTVAGLEDDADVSATFVATNGYRGYDPPETTITSGPSGTVDTRSASFRYSTSSLTLDFECRLDDGEYRECDSAGTNYTGLADGEHTFFVRGVDDWGVPDPTPASRTWTIDVGPPPDTEAPETTIESGPSGTVDTGSASFKYSSSESGSTFECRLDDGDFESCPADGRDYTGLADGEHTFQVRATDAGDNTDDSPASRTWTIDSTPPGGDDDGDETDGDETDGDETGDGDETDGDETDGDGDGSGDGDESDDDDSDGDPGSDRSDDSSGLLPDTGGLPLALAVLALLLLPLGAVTTWAGRRRAAVSRHHGRSDHVEP